MMMENEILIISSTTKEAMRFIESVKDLSGSSSLSASEGESVPLSVPWTITNRYYDADVHFSVWTMERVFVELFERQTPAVVYVWTEGEGYVEDVKEIARMMKLGEYEAEVALAVRIRGEEEEREERREDENGDIDSMLMSFGFEYVDGTLKEDKDGIPGLPRVVDALGTIIWPSMRMKGEDSEDERERMIQELLDDEMGFEDDFCALDLRESAARVAIQVVYGI